MSRLACLTNDKLALLRKVVFGDLEVERGGALANTSGYVVVGAVARAEPASEVAGLADGHTTQVGADTCVLSVSRCPAGIQRSVREDDACAAQQ